MINGKFDHIKEWQNEVFDDKMKENLLKGLLFSEVKQFSVFLSKNNIQIPDNFLDEYAKDREFC